MLPYFESAKWFSTHSQPETHAIICILQVSKLSHGEMWKNASARTVCGAGWEPRGSGSQVLRPLTPLWWRCKDALGNKCQERWLVHTVHAQQMTGGVGRGKGKGKEGGETGGRNKHRLRKYTHWWRQLHRIAVTSAITNQDNRNELLLLVSI